MAAPSISVRGMPTGIRLEDGFSTKISFASNVTIEFWERTVKPPGIDGGDAIPTSTMHNVAVHTFAPRHLKKYDPITVMVNYDPKCLVDVNSLINVRDSITLKFPDGSTLCFYGYLQKFEPGELKEGEEPDATITIIVTNWDPVNHLEVPPVYTDVAGT